MANGWSDSSSPITITPSPPGGAQPQNVAGSLLSETAVGIANPATGLFDLLREDGPGRIGTSDYDQLAVIATLLRCLCKLQIEANGMNNELDDMITAESFDNVVN